MKNRGIEYETFRREVIRILRESNEPKSWKEIRESSKIFDMNFLPHNFLLKLANEPEIRAIRTKKGLKFFLTDKTEKNEVSTPREKVRIQCTVCQEYKEANNFIAIGTWNKRVEAFNTSFFICGDCQKEHLSNKSLNWLRDRLKE